MNHQLTQTESYFGMIHANESATVLRPADGGRFDALNPDGNHGMGNLYREHCSCGWVSSWSRKMVAAMNGGKAHLRAEARR